MRCNSPAITLGILLAGLFFLIASVPASADEESSKRGRHLFLKGETFNGEAVTANVGEASIPVPATALPCASCHGRSGQGKPEGGVRPSNITWENLTKSYGGETLLGRRYTRYDEKSFLIAVTEGIDSAGNKLDSSMPRFNISRQDARDLISYLQVIQNDYDPGVSDSEIVIASLQPENPPQSRIAESMLTVIEARMAEINQQGGVYGRQLKLEVVRYTDRLSFAHQARRMAEREDVFAVLCAYSGSGDPLLKDLADEVQIPSIAPYTQFPAEEGGSHLYTFYLHGGLGAQTGVLARRISEAITEGGRVAVLYHRQAGFEANANGAVKALKDLNLENVDLIAYDETQGQTAIEQLATDKSPPAAILFVGPSSDLVEMLKVPQAALADTGLYIPGIFVGSNILELDKTHAGNLEMAYLNVPATGQDNTIERFRQFMQRNRFKAANINASLFAFGATETLVEGIKQSGKRVSRQKLIEALENTWQFDAGLSQPVSFGSRRRTAQLGAYTVRFDAETRQLVPGDWVRLD